MEEIKKYSVSSIPRNEVLGDSPSCGESCFNKINLPPGSDRDTLKIRYTNEGDVNWCLFQQSCQVFLPFLEQVVKPLINGKDLVREINEAGKRTLCQVKSW